MVSTVIGKSLLAENVTVFNFQKQICQSQYKKAKLKLCKMTNLIKWVKTMVSLSNQLIIHNYRFEIDIKKSTDTDKFYIDRNTVSPEMMFVHH